MNEKRMMIQRQNANKAPRLFQAVVAERKRKATQPGGLQRY